MLYNINRCSISWHLFEVRSESLFLLTWALRTASYIAIILAFSIMRFFHKAAPSILHGSV